MESHQHIEHDGIVISISDRKIVVKILAQSACSECHAKGACSAADMQDKHIDIVPDGHHYQTGQRVTITGNQAMGFKAVLYAYVIPSLLIIAALIISNAFIADDIVAASVSLVTVAVYYIIIYLFRERLHRTFTFTIQNQL